MQVMQDEDLQMLYSPSHTPEFSAVENAFADMKRQMGSFQFTSVERTASEMVRILFKYSGPDLQVFYKKVFRNILDFWDQTDKDKILNDMDL